MGMPRRCVRLREPMRKGGGLGVVAREKDKMPVIGHQAIGQNGHGHAGVRLVHHALKGGIILRLEKQCPPPHAAVEHMVNKPSRSMTGLSWHVGKWYGEGHGRSI